MSEDSAAPKFRVPSVAEVESHANKPRSKTLFFKPKGTLELGGLKEDQSNPPIPSVTSSSSTNDKLFPDLNQLSKLDDSTTSPGKQPVRPTSNTPPVPTVKAPVTPIRSRGSGNTIIVNPCQRGNPILQHVRNVPWEYGEIVPDYQVGISSCVLFLSLRYHRLHPEYVFNRIQKLGRSYLLRVILCMVDIENHEDSIRELTKACIVNELTLVLAWSQEEAGRYLETYKSFEHKPPDLIKEKVDNDYLSKATDSLTQIKSVNKTDVLTLLSSFGSVKRVIEATAEELAMCPGFGDKKVKRIRKAFTEPFRLNKARP
ncbi:DNA repair protein rad10, partial [Basidiobolus meristosporus CBS 931.73]